MVVRVGVHVLGHGGAGGEEGPLLVGVVVVGRRGGGVGGVLVDDVVLGRRGGGKVVEFQLLLGWRRRGGVGVVVLRRIRVGGRGVVVGMALGRVDGLLGGVGRGDRGRGGEGVAVGGRRLLAVVGVVGDEDAVAELKGDHFLQGQGQVVVLLLLLLLGVVHRRGNHGRRGGRQGRWAVVVVRGCRLGGRGRGGRGGRGGGKGVVAVGLGVLAVVGGGRGQGAVPAAVVGHVGGRKRHVVVLVDMGGGSEGAPLLRVVVVHEVGELLLLLDVMPMVVGRAFHKGVATHAAAVVAVGGPVGAVGRDRVVVGVPVQLLLRVSVVLGMALQLRMATRVLLRRLLLAVVVAAGLGLEGRRHVAAKRVVGGLGGEMLRDGRRVSRKGNLGGGRGLLGHVRHVLGLAGRRLLLRGRRHAGRGRGGGRRGAAGRGHEGERRKSGSQGGRGGRGGDLAGRGGVRGAARLGEKVELGRRLVHGHAVAAFGSRAAALRSRTTLAGHGFAWTRGRDEEAGELWGKGCEYG